MRFLTLLLTTALIVSITACDDGGGSTSSSGTRSASADNRTYIQRMIELREAEMASGGRASDTKGDALSRIGEFRRVMNANLAVIEGLVADAGQEWQDKYDALQAKLDELNEIIDEVRPMDPIDWEPLKPALIKLDEVFTEVGSLYSELNSQFADQLGDVNINAPGQNRGSGGPPSGAGGRPGGPGGPPRGN